jgi:hypothetical protein
MHFLRTKLSFALIGAALLAAGVTSAAVAAGHQPDPPVCYSVCPSATGLSVSLRTVRYGREYRAVFQASVRPRVGGVRGLPRGVVNVRFGRTALCAITLDNGQGSCSLSSRALRPRLRPYLINAAYNGNRVFSGSRSGRHYLKVIR